MVNALNLMLIKKLCLIYTYENVSMGACSIQSALDTLKDDDKQQILDNLENGIVS